MNPEITPSEIEADEPKILRSAALHVQIEQYLLEQIRSGAIKIGDRLPPAAELATKLRVHEVTVQKALRRLKVAGILQRTPRVGTFVKSSPESTQVAIIFGPNISDEASHFYRAMLKALQTLIHNAKQRYRVYDNINAAKNETDLAALPSYQRYLADRSSCVFAGKILIGCDVQWLNFFKKTPFPPCVSGSDGNRPGMDVSFDRAATARECVAYLASHGRKKLLYLRTVPDGWGDMEGFKSALDAAGFDEVRVDQLAMQRENHYHEAVAYEHISALVQQWGETGKKPDCILVSDDIAMRGVALGLIRHGIKVPDEIEVLVWANEGIRHHYGIPVTKYEVSPRLFAKALYEVLRARMSGTEPANLPQKIEGHIVLPTAEMPPESRSSTAPGIDGKVLQTTA